MTADAISKMSLPWSDYQEEGFIGSPNGILHVRFHDLRHTFATRLVQSGVDLYKVSKLLGHRDIKTTQRYAHHYPESLRDGVEVWTFYTPKIRVKMVSVFTIFS
jgi:integrase